MFYFTEPSPGTVARFIDSQRDMPFSYQAVGATKTKPPDDFTIDHNRIQLGNGPAVYQRAMVAIKTWRQFDLGWVSIVPEGVSVQVGNTVAVKARAFGTWSLSAARLFKPRYQTRDQRGTVMPLTRFRYVATASSVCWSLQSNAFCAIPAAAATSSNP